MLERSQEMVNVTSLGHWPALCYAARYGIVDIVRRLLRDHAAPLPRTRIGKLPAHLTTEGSMRSLLEMAADGHVGCHSKNGMRSDRQAPRATANEISITRPTSPQLPSRTLLQGSGSARSGHRPKRPQQSGMGCGRPLSSRRGTTRSSTWACLTSSLPTVLVTWVGP